jgi:hypothetical protein
MVPDHLQEEETKMSITPLQAAARRANSQHSTGPRSAQGKAAVSQNAVKSGFFARSPLLPGESDTEFAAFRDGWIDSLHPEDAAEVALVDRIADSAWRLRRFPAVEAGLYTATYLSEQAALARRRARQLVEQDLEAGPEEASDPELFRQLQAQESEIREELNSPQYAMGRAFQRDAERADGFARLSRCEMLLDRAFYRCLRELLLMQAERRRTQYEIQNKATEVVEPVL